MSKYSDVFKKSVDQEQKVFNEYETVTFANEKPKFNITRPPKKPRNYSYDIWEYAYFPHLVKMYKIFSGNENAWDPVDMHHYFRFIYDVSSGEISKYLDDITEKQHDAYLEYQIKKNDV